MGKVTLNVFASKRHNYSMRRFEELGVIGDGGFGTVTKCRDKETGELVAIKKMKQKYATFDECLQLKEVKSLRKIKHENVERLLQVFRENDYLYLVFELLPDGSLLNLEQKKGTPFPEPEIRYIIEQLLNGLNFVHRQGFFHRDIKPENLLWSGDTLKIADFGLAREIRSRPPYTEYVSTRWYRAPEIILRHEFYNSPVDIWAVGAIMAEMFLGRPLFQGTSETDQLFKIIGVLGTPSANTWPDGLRLANRLGIRMPQQAPVSLASLLPNASPAAIDLISAMLRYDPSKRPSASQALQHKFFTDGPKVPPSQAAAAKKGGEEESFGTFKADPVQKPSYMFEEPKLAEPTMVNMGQEPQQGPGMKPFLKSILRHSCDRFEVSAPLDKESPKGAGDGAGFRLGASPIRNGSNINLMGAKYRAGNQAILGGLPQQQPRFGMKQMISTAGTGVPYRGPVEGASSPMADLPLSDDDDLLDGLL